MVKIWLDFNFAEAYLNTSLFINIKIIIIIYLLFNYLRTGRSIPVRDCHATPFVKPIQQKSFLLKKDGSV